MPLTSGRSSDMAHAGRRWPARGLLFRRVLRHTARLAFDEKGCDVAAFKDEAEVYEYLGGIFRLGMDDPELVAKLRPTGIILRITYTEPDAVLTVDMPNTKVYEGTGAGPEPNVELHMTADTGNRFWLGKVVLPVALAKGQVRAKGPVAKLLKVLPLAKGMFGPYRERLETDGRADLLED